MEIIWREVAFLSLERARSYIAQDNPAAAQRVYERILRCVRNLADMTNMGRPGRVEDTRELVVPDTPYIVAYTVLGEQVVIIAVQHSAQKRPDGSRADARVRRARSAILEAPRASQW